MAAGPAGRRHPLSLAQLQQRYAYISPLGLQQALALLLAHKQQHGVPQPACRGVTSLLEVGQLSVLPTLEAPGRPGPPPSWLRPPHTHSAGPSRLLLREVGASGYAHSTEQQLPPGRYAELMRYHRTLRGHRFAVYCCTWDKSGRYLITGSDDHLVKASQRCLSPTVHVLFLLRLGHECGFHLDC